MAFTTLRQPLLAIRRFWRQLVAKLGFGYSFFICHAADNAPYAEAVRVALERKRLLSFLDERSLYTLDGEGTISERLTKAIRKSGALLVIDTPVARQKPFPALEIQAALAAKRLLLVRIQAEGNREPWVHLDDAAKVAIENSTRYNEFPANIDRATPSPDVIAKVATHLNWRRYWPLLHRSIGAVAAMAVVIEAAAWDVSRVATTLRVNPTRAQAAQEAAHLFGAFAPLFARISPSTMSDIRSILLATYAWELEFAPKQQASPLGDCPDQERPEAGSLPPNTLEQLKAADPEAIRWHVDPTARYLFSERGENAKSNIWRVSAESGHPVAELAAEWQNEGRKTCASAFTYDGALLLLAQRHDTKAELRLLAVPSGLPIGEAIVLEGKLPLAMTVNGAQVSITTDAGTSRLEISSRPTAWVLPHDEFPHSGRIGPNERVALSSGIMPCVDICRRDGTQLRCDHVWPEPLRRGSDDADLAEIDSLEDTGNGTMELMFHTPGVQVTCYASDGDRWSCAKPTRMTAPAPNGRFVRMSPYWKIDVTFEPSDSLAVISHLGLWGYRHVELRRPGRILDAFVGGDVLRLLTWASKSIVIEQIALSESSFHERAMGDAGR